MDPRLLPTLFGIAMVLSLLELGPLMLRKRRRTATTRGMVVGCSAEATQNAEVGSYNPPTFHAVVEFEVGGQTRQTVASAGVSWKKPRIGEMRTVEYEPANPENCGVREGKLLEFLGYWAPGMGLPVAGVVLLLWTWLPR